MIIMMIHQHVRLLAAMVDDMPESGGCAMAMRWLLNDVLFDCLARCNGAGSISLTDVGTLAACTSNPPDLPGVPVHAFKIGCLLHRNGVYLRSS